MQNEAETYAQHNEAMRIDGLAVHLIRDHRLAESEVWGTHHQPGGLQGLQEFHGKLHRRSLPTTKEETMQNKTDHDHGDGMRDVEHWQDSYLRLHISNHHRENLLEAMNLPEDRKLSDLHKAIHDGRLIKEEKAKGTEVQRWADAAMFRSEPLKASEGPRVTLLNATPDPLGSLAALYAMYTGKVVRSLADVTDDERRGAFADMFVTELQGPLEVAQFHFLVEGVTRSFTHQMVRERQAFFAQESMRFAVPDGEEWPDRVALPPSLSEPKPTVTGYTTGADWDVYGRQRDAWDDAVITAQRSYQILIDSGMPAEDARGLMPHAMTTRLHWVLDLRGLLHVAGLRLCTQAQFEWRHVMAGVVKALRSYADDLKGSHHPTGDATWWQFGHIADHLRPVCYQKGQCGFMAKFDRGCTIRERVEANAKAGRPSSLWDQDAYVSLGIRAINNSEWAADPTAARRGN
jgi:flavin-dependent thymidylate synthase